MMLTPPVILAMVLCYVAGSLVRSPNPRIWPWYVLPLVLAGALMNAALSP